jgi:predicted small lipoprotein YifL
MKREIAAIACLVALSAVTGCGFGGDDSSVPGAALTPPDTSWLPGQDPLGAYAEFAAVFDPAVELAERKLKRRELELERIEKAKIAARKRAQEEARRAYLRAKRRAERAYKRALREAARRRRELQERLERKKERLARKKRAYERKRRVEVGPECRLPGVRERYRCRVGKTPVPESDEEGK